MTTNSGGAGVMPKHKGFLGGHATAREMGECRICYEDVFGIANGTEAQKKVKPFKSPMVKNNTIIAF